MRTHWFPASEKVQDTEVIKESVGVCLLGQGWNFACRLPGKGVNHHSKVALLNKLKQQFVSKCRGKLSKGILFLQENVFPHRTSITHQKWKILTLSPETPSLLT
jgi:hypothetical protein